jgi:hypothetical protein
MKKPKQKTIKFSELKRLCVCNSPRCPKQIEVVGKVKGKLVRVVKEYVGIGWIDILPHQEKNPVLVVEG